MRYVTFNPETGALTGAYLQDLQPEHAACYIEVDEAVYDNWTAYGANPERDGVELGGAAEPVDPPPTVPHSVTRRQARQALLLAGLLDDVLPAIEAIPDETQRRLAMIEWEDSLEFLRDRPLVIQIGAALGLDATALDELFTTAANL